MLILATVWQRSSSSSQAGNSQGHKVKCLRSKTPVKQNSEMVIIIGHMKHFPSWEFLPKYRTPKATSYMARDLEEEEGENTLACFAKLPPVSTVALSFLLHQFEPAERSLKILSYKHTQPLQKDVCHTGSREN